MSAPETGCGCAHVPMGAVCFDHVVAGEDLDRRAAGLPKLGTYLCLNCGLVDDLRFGRCSVCDGKVRLWMLLEVLLVAQGAISAPLSKERCPERGMVGGNGPQCELEKGHRGAHSVFSKTFSERCSEREGNGHGYQCELAAGHLGQHACPEAVARQYGRLPLGKEPP